VSQYSVGTFYEDAHLDAPRKKYSSERRQESVYAEIEITGCQHKDWWYAKHIGFTLLAQIRFHNYGYGRFVQEFVAVDLTNTRVTKGRTIDAKDAKII
jgi:hypothetical protein